MALPMPSLEIMFLKSAFQIYVHMYTYIVYTHEKVFSKTQSICLELALQQMQTLFCVWNSAYRVLEKSDIDIYIYRFYYIYIYIYI